MSSHRPLIPLLEADPELGEGLAPADLAAATRSVGVHPRTLEPGPVAAARRAVARPADARPARARGRRDARDPLRRADDDRSCSGRATCCARGRTTSQFDPLPFGVAWHVHEPTRVALLDARVALATARWPVLAGTLSRRHVRRARSLAFQLAIAQLPRVDDRLLVLLWALAERWGRVSPQGVRLPLALPHRTLATLVGARRPSVTTALSGLARDGLVERTEEGWLLHGDPDEVFPGRLHTPVRARVAAEALGL